MIRETASYKQQTDGPCTLSSNAGLSYEVSTRGPNKPDQDLILRAWTFALPGRP